MPKLRRILQYILTDTFPNLRRSGYYLKKKKKEAEGSRPEQSTLSTLRTWARRSERGPKAITKYGS